MDHRVTYGTRDFVAVVSSVVAGFELSLQESEVEKSVGYRMTRGFFAKKHPLFELLIDT
jgi:hypothetical protein